MQGDNYFSIIPEWVLDAPISATTVRLYCVLQRYANSHGVCFPSRSTLARRCQVSIKTVDRCVDELEGIGALTVEKKRADKGDWANNVYTVITSDPRRVATKTTLPSDKNDATGSDRNDPLTKAIENESQRTISTRSLNSEQARGISQAWWEKQDRPTGKFIALVKIVERTLDAGWEPQIVSQALGTFVVIPSLAQLELQMKGKRGVQTKYDRNRQVLEQSLQQQKNDAIRLAFDALEKGNENEFE
jgi:hypothetical protein